MTRATLPPMLRWLPQRWRGAALMPVAALVVHQLRYWLAYGPAAHRELLEQGHAYLSSLTPWIVTAAALGLGAFLTRLARAWRIGRDEQGRRRSLLALWLSTAAMLLAIYAGQELLEGLLASGHPGGLAAVFGDGGLWAIPAAVVVGGALALLIRGGATAIALIARLARRRRRPPQARASTPPGLVALAPFAPLATAAAGRAPPAGRRLP